VILFEAAEQLAKIISRNKGKTSNSTTLQRNSRVWHKLSKYSNGKWLLDNFASLSLSYAILQDQFKKAITV